MATTTNKPEAPVRTTWQEYMDAQKGYVPKKEPAQRMEVGKQPVQSDYNFYDQLSREYLERPMTPEEQARRERAAYTAKGVTDLGNALGALGNMFFVNKGAAPQQLPTTPDIDTKVSAMRERADKVRQNYLQGRMTARQGDQNEYNAAYSRWQDAFKFNADQDQKDYDNGLKGLNAQADLAKGAAGLDKTYRDEDWRAKEAARDQRNKDTAFSLQRRGLSLQERHQNWVENNGGSGAGSTDFLRTNGPTQAYVPSANGTPALTPLNIDWGKGAYVTAQIYNSNYFPADIKKKYQYSMISVANNPAKTAEYMRDAVIDAMRNDPEFSVRAYQELDNVGAVGSATGAGLQQPSYGPFGGSNGRGSSNAGEKKSSW